ncbi:hypothetical protein CDAR_80721 [Caerostris darwini]|uniref:Uncharacterized protein n=1 Tax=Caerostris darwini TaxID=1538125 RepID=A0AAV4R8G4_9ARAC|nr:hypothetical protein CDAR_80721 [Caerostris darwini]
MPGEVCAEEKRHWRHGHVSSSARQSGKQPPATRFQTDWGIRAFSGSRTLRPLAGELPPGNFWEQAECLSWWNNFPLFYFVSDSNSKGKV